MAKSQMTDKVLLTALVQQGLASEADLQELLDKQNEAFQAHQHLVSGIAYVIDPLQGVLILQSYPQGEEIARFELGTEQRPRFAADEWDPWGSHAFLASQDEISRLETFDFDVSEPYGLVVLSDKVYLYNNGQLDTQHVGLAKQALYGAVYKGKPASSPFDLYLSANQQWLCISDRGAGSVSLLNLETRAMQGPVQVRSPGGTSTLNIAIDEANARALITDNQTAGLYLLDFESLQIERQRLGLGILGNLVMAPEKDYLYLISVKPNAALHYVNIAKWEAEKSIKLKGGLFKADSSAPCDLLSLSPTGEHLLIMTYLNDPKPFTPVLTVIDTRQTKTTRRYSLKDGVKPIQLAYGLLNPVFEHTRPLETLAVKAGLVGPQAMWNLKRELALQMGEELIEDLAEMPGQDANESDTVEELDAAEEPAAVLEIVELRPEETEPGTIDTRNLLENDPESETLNLTPKKSSPISLNKEMTVLIVALLINTLESQCGESLADRTELKLALQAPADEARQQLESFDSTIVQVEKIYQQYDLKTVILREAVLKAWEARRSSEGEVAPPARCPNCEARLESWDCESCGYELDSPERRRKNMTNSATATSNLPHGHFALPDPQGLRLLQLNPFKYISWNLEPDKVPAQYPIDLIWLPNENLLVTDKDGHAVVEVSLRGEQFWRFDTQKSAAHRLNEPVKATFYIPENSGERHYLIVDQGNHRVLEVNNRSEIIKSFGIQAESGAEPHLLDLPQDVQFTHQQTYLIADTGNDRVIEYQQTGEIARIFGPELGLKSPTNMQRLLNQHTLIVDAGNYRLLELDAEGQIVNECLYFNSSIDPAFHIVSPIRMIRLFNSDVLVMDEDKLIQVNLRTSQLVWFSKLENLAFQPKVDAPQLITDENGVEKLVYKVLDHGTNRPVRLSQKINFKRMQQLITARLKLEAKTSSGEKKDNKTNKLQALIEERKLLQKSSLRRMLSQDSIQPSQIYKKEGAELQKMRYYLIDRNHNSVLRLNRKGEVKWSYGVEMGQSLLRPHHISETRTTLLIGDTSNNRIAEISKTEREMVREFKLDGGSPLTGPRSARRISDEQTLIADTRGKRLLILNAEGQPVWEYANSSEVKSPQYAEELGDGHILYVDAMLNMVREIDREGQTHWSYGTRLKGRGPNQLFAPEFATRLANGHTLIADTRNNRVIEADATGKEIWSYEGDAESKRQLLNPFYAERLDNGNTRIAYNNSRELLEVSATGELLWWYKMGNDVFLQPVTGSTHGLTQDVEELIPYYNPIEKRLIRAASTRNTQGVEAHICFMENVQMKSVRASLMLMRAEQFGTVLKTFPSPEELLASKFGKNLIITLILDAGQDPETVNTQLGNLAEVESTNLVPLFFEEDLKKESEDSNTSAS